MYDEGIPVVQWGEGRITPEGKETNLDSYLTLYTSNLRWIMYQNVKDKTIKILNENIGESLHDLTVDKRFQKALTLI